MRRPLAGLDAARTADTSATMWLKPRSVSPDLTIKFRVRLRKIS
jgi:hypothetical protein